MYVGLKMLKRGQFPTVTAETPIARADKLMLQNRLWMLLVVDEGRLVGRVNKEEVKAALPSAATDLSRHEINTLLARLKVGSIMRKDVPCVLPETEIEEAARLMYDDDLPGLAVVDRNNALLGFINRNVMLDILVEEMGLKQGGSRIVFEVEDRSGVMHEVSGIIASFGISIIATGTFFHNNRRIVVVRVQTEDPGQIIKALSEKGYTMVGPDTFAGEWS